jgi:small subunit ribosomal protein S20
MANTAQARKRARQSVALNKHNSSLRSMLRTAIKRVRTAIETGDKSAAADILQKATSVIDRVADKNIIHKNKKCTTTETSWNCKIGIHSSMKEPY